MTAFFLSEQAENDLRENLKFIAEKDGLERALLIHDRFLKAFDLLSTSPGMGFRRLQLTGEEIRWWPESGFLIIYDTENKVLRILRVIHGARAIERILKDVFGGG